MQRRFDNSGGKVVTPFPIWVSRSHCQSSEKTNSLRVVSSILFLLRYARIRNSRPTSCLGATNYCRRLIHSWQTTWVGRRTSASWHFPQIFFRITGDFSRCAHVFACGILIDDLYQALRNVWIMMSFQVLFDRTVELTNSVFAYSMLYPFTDKGPARNNLDF